MTELENGGCVVSLGKDDPLSSTALVRGREAAETHMEEREAADLGWNEETVTDIYLPKTIEFANAAQFTRNQEGLVGADWLWWWLDASGEAFGLLVQAKKITRRGRAHHLSLHHTNVRGDQYELLGTAAELLGVVPLYALYLGPAAARMDLACGKLHSGQACQHCRPATVSFVPALVAREYVLDRKNAIELLSYVMPMEYLARDASHPVSDINVLGIAPDLGSFLQSTQTGARAVAKHVFDAVSTARAAEFRDSLPRLGFQTFTSSEMFRNMPSDAGRFGVPYFPHVFRGLRRRAPSYVFDIVATGTTSHAFPPSIAGVVVMQV